MPDIDYGSLAAAVQRSRLILKWARQARVEIVRECAGHRFAEGGATRPVKLNLLALYQSILGPLLIAKEPRYLVTTADQEARASVRVEQDWLNEQVVHVNLAETLRRVVTDAFYSTGICWVALASPCEAATLAWGITAGEPVVRTVDLDDFVYDVGAKEFGEATYVGHRYRCPLDVAKKMYGKKAKDLQGEDEPQFNKEGDERIGRILRGTHSVEEFEDHVELWQLYLPRHKLVVTLSDQDVTEAGKDGSPKPLWTQRWVGPPWGPYHFLKFGTVPGTAMAKAPLMDLMELHLDANNVRRKVNNMIRRMKEITLYPRQNDLDAQEIQKSSDGDMVPVTDPDRIKPVVTAGAAIQGLLQTGEVYKNEFSFMGSNLELLGGRGAQSRTATQDKILNQNAGGQIEGMRAQVEAFVAAVGESVWWYAHNHPQLVMESRYKASGSRGVNRRLYPADSPQGPRRDFPFHRAKLRLDPYSIRHKTPEERLAYVTQVLGQLTPLMPLLQQQGVVIDANFLVSLFADYGDAPELTELFTARPPPGDGAGPSGGHERTLPGQTDRTYTRRNEPQGDQPGQAVGEMSPSDFGASTNGQMQGAT